ncbi:MAG: outer membrane beta-barrel protein [Ichthyobacteriaceae bacterium]|nr:outer membrane beta-barrel protein [Ichthyobacteriaceae bacterium]
MKKFILMFALIVSTYNVANAQIAWGVLAGPNYNWSGVKVDNYSSDSSAGWHAGGFLRVKIPIVGLYVQAEPTYTNLNVKVVNNNNRTETLKTHRFDMPILLGWKFLVFGKIFGGPVLSANTGNSAGGWDVDVDNNFSAGFQMGAGVELGKFSIDLRYEGANSSNVVVDGFKFDNRSRQIIMNFAYELN